MDNVNICTVLMVSYNHENYIKDAIESVLEQKTKYSFKIHIFDDFSQDNTRKIINEYVKKYPKLIIPFFQEKNKGAQGNIWDAYNSVDTKYCILLECDDYWCDKTKLNRQIKIMEKHPECSFCGHNCKVVTLNEEAREYDNNALICTNPILKKKNIFGYDDFRYIFGGGYSPYVSARLVRTESIGIKNIKYKESFLFDHTQFYYLLLKGKYYYIDRPMSVYRRTGQGTCSIEEPLTFLNTFIQNSLDFNKETNFEIADKIFSDCILQSEFRLLLYRRRNVQKLELLAKPNKLNICSCIALGDTYILAGLGKAIEKKYGAPIHFIIKPQYEVVMKMYNIEDYTIFKDFDSVEWDKVAKYSQPTKGKIFLAHPNFYEEYHPMYFELKYKRCEEDFITFIKKFLGISKESKFEYHKWFPDLSDTFKEKFKNYNLKKVILLSPTANSVTEYKDEFWVDMAKDFSSEGYKVFINSPREFKCKYAENWNLSLEDALALGKRCHSVYAMRSGFCDLLQDDCKDLNIYYSDPADLYIFGMENMFGEKKNIKEVLKFNQSIQEYQRHNFGNPKPDVPLLFGFIRIPNKVYNFYNKHRKFFRNQKLIRFFVKWK